MPGFEKLQIERDDEPKTTFSVQYNPERYSVEKSSTWNERGRRATLQYGGRGRKSVTFELFFDTYAERESDNEEDFEDVREKYINDLLVLMEPTVDTSTGNKRPPVLIISWGGFALKCVLEKLSQNYTMFSQSGVPVRAVVATVR